MHNEASWEKQLQPQWLSGRTSDSNTEGTCRGTWKRGKRLAKLTEGLIYGQVGFHDALGSNLVWHISGHLSSLLVQHGEAASLVSLRYLNYQQPYTELQIS